MHITASSMQQQHALEIPEILALVGSFLPLWKPPTLDYSYSGTLYVFQPKTLVSCLQVSKLWHRTLLPILWYGYWGNSMDMTVPEDVVARHSHFFRILDLEDWSTSEYRDGERDSSMFECKSLVDLGVVVGGKEELTGAKRLLLANPGIKTLGWIGAEGEGSQYGSLSVLDAEDFEGLTGLESLYLHFWNCSGNNGRRLREVLRRVGGSLKELRLERMRDVSPDVFSTSGLLSSSQQEVEDLPGESVLLAQLETLRLGHCGNTDRCSAELVQCCPKLKKLCYSSNLYDWSICRLAISLEKHCPKFESLEVRGVLEPDQIETLVRHCRRQLRMLHFSVMRLKRVDDNGQGQGQGDLVSNMLEHSGTLEDIYIHVARRGLDTGPQLLRLLAGCTKLRRFMTTLSDNASDDCALLEALKQQQWEGCQGTLEVLEFEVSSRRGGRTVKPLKIIREERRQKESKMRKIGYEMGWVEEDAREGGEGESNGEGEGGDSPMVRMLGDANTFRKLLEVVQFQELKALKRLVVRGRAFRRSVPTDGVVAVKLDSIQKRREPEQDPPFSCTRIQKR